MKPIVVFSTTDSYEAAQKIASALVEAHAAACVNIVPGLHSIYRWQGEICDSQEWLLIIKTASDRFEAVRSLIRRLHSYDLPEVIAVPIEGGDADYLKWLSSELK
jgi:periplasmic divalent cation tolerance protein